MSPAPARRGGGKCKVSACKCGGLENSKGCNRVERQLSLRPRDQESESVRGDIGERSRHPARLPRGGGEGLLVAALDVLGGIMGTGGQEPWSPEGFRLSGEIQIDALRSWADRDGLWIDPNDLGTFRRGRREHDLFRRSDLLPIVFKITRGACFGLVPSPINVASGNLLETLVRALNQIRPSV